MKWIDCGGPFNVVLPPPPDLQVSQVGAPATLLTSQRGQATWTVVNAGTGPTVATGWTDSVYLSRDTNLDPTTAITAANTGPKLTAIKSVHNGWVPNKAETPIPSGAVTAAATATQNVRRGGAGINNGTVAINIGTQE